MINTVTEREKWERIISEFPFSSFFWFPDWYYALLKSEKNASAGLLTVQIDDRQAYVPFLKKQYGPFYGIYSGPDGSYGGILNTHNKLGEEILQYVKKKFLRFPTLHLTFVPHPLVSQEIQDAKPLSVETTWIIKGPVNFEDYFKNSLSSRRKRNYRKAEKEKVRISVATSEDIELFFEWYKNGNWVKFYPKAFWYHLYKSERTEVLTVKKAEETIAVAWFLLGKGEVFYFMGLFNRKYTDISPMGFMLIEVVRRYLKKGGFKVLNLGSSIGISSIEEFKRSLGAIPLPVKVFRYYHPILKLFQP